MKKLTFALLLAVAACGGSSKSSTTPPAATAPATGDIVDTAVGAGSFTTLVAAVQAAGLVDTLKGEGPFTVFAPTDEAFAKLPPGTVESLLKDKAKLTAILTYHVVPGRVTAADVGGLTTATTVQGGALAIDTSAGVKINDATVVQADVMASNGVIHVIDTVLMPPM
ncbi:MAG: fasciclin domain-containing protein [Myxococcales bacterium]|nr:fasciclin domain-containing protein [Myxococcales bacterium]MBK7194743.1 fasciclin domain-containing protein [Myxococcales bacterium]MBP6843675.1 fasciclin domain-containing protein [Kofleriaceae bacterium]